MKKQREDALYVEKEDLAYLGITSEMSDLTASIYFKAVDGWIPFKKPKSIEYFNDHKEIYDYDDISQLSDEEINKMLIKIEEDIFYYEHQFFNFVSRDFLAKDVERKKALKKLNYQRESLTRYLEKRHKNTITL